MSAATVSAWPGDDVAVLMLIRQLAAMTPTARAAARAGGSHVEVVERDPEALATRLLVEGREELTRADTKASILLATSGVVTAALLASLLGGKWTPHRLADHPNTRAAFWAGAALAAAGVVLLAAAVAPRTKHSAKERSNLAYFGHVLMHRERGWELKPAKRHAKVAAAKRNLKESMLAASATTFDRTVDQVWTISAIVGRKYRYIKTAMVAYGLGAGLCVAAVVIHSVL